MEYSKKLLIVIIIFNCWKTPLYGQLEYVNFDDTDHLEAIKIDTLNNNGNIWEIGLSNKENFVISQSTPKAIMTDTLNPYPTNDTSIFYQTYDQGFLNAAVLSLDFIIDSDTLTDFGKIEISGDDGVSWIDIVEESSLYDFDILLTSNTIFSGSSNGVEELWISFFSWINNPESYPSNYQGGDVIFRFTFISDSIQTNKNGWIIDNLGVRGWVLNTEDFESDRLIKVYPNPGSNLINIELPQNEDVELYIYSSNGKLINYYSKFKSTLYSIEELPTGLYIFKAKSGKEYTVKKIIKN